MRLFIFLFLLLVQNFLFAQENTKINIQNYYKPSSAYLGDYKKITKSTFSFVGENTQVIEILKPIIQAQYGIDSVYEENKRFVIKTTPLFNDTLFNMDIYLSDVNRQIKFETLPENLILKSEVSTNGTVKLLPYQASFVSDEEQLMLSNMIDQFLKFKIPNDEVGIGDSILSNEKLKLPITGNDIELNMSTKYILKEITNGLAYFNVLQLINADNIQIDTDFSIGINVTGNGFLIYDINNEFVNSEEMNVIMHASTSLYGVILKVESNEKVIITREYKNLNP